MKARGPMQPYNLLAKYYDAMAQGADVMNRYARRHTVADILSGIESVCDLGCGNGDTALDFARRGLEVSAVDLSPVFCRKVREKFRRAKLPVRVVQADMRTFRLPAPVDLVTCEFAALNHVQRTSDLARVLKSVHRALRPGGWFVFDVNSCASLREQYSATHWIETKQFKVVFRGNFDPRRSRAVLDFEWFLPQGRLWKHRSERVVNVCWPIPEIRRTLLDTGFRRIRTWDGMDVRPAHPEARRGYDLYFRAQKPLRRK